MRLLLALLVAVVAFGALATEASASLPALPAEHQVGALAGGALAGDVGLGVELAALDALELEAQRVRQDLADALLASELAPPDGFSLAPPPRLARLGTLLDPIAHPVEPLRFADLAPGDLPSLSKTRVWASSQNWPVLATCENRVSREDASGYELGLARKCVGRITTNLYAYVAFTPSMAMDPLGLYSWGEFKRDASFAADVYVGTYANLYNPRNAWKNTQRAVGGLVGTGKMLGETVVGVASLVADNATPLAATRPDAMMRNAQRVQGIANFAAHPIDTVVQGHAQAIANIEAHEARGEYFQSGIVGGELGSTDALVTIGAGELALAGARATSNAIGRMAFPEGLASPYTAPALAEGYSGMTGEFAQSTASVSWRNGWRTADGKFASPLGAGRSGAAAEQSVWDAVRQKPGWRVVEGRVYVENAAGEVRVYDGAAISPRGRAIGLEVKSGSAARTSSQAAFDAGVNTCNPAIGVGQNAGLEIGRALLIEVP